MSCLGEGFDFGYDEGGKKRLLLGKEEKRGRRMGKGMMRVNGVKMVIMLGMVVIIVWGMGFGGEMMVGFIVGLFIGVIVKGVVEEMVGWGVGGVVGVWILMRMMVMGMVLVLGYVGWGVKELRGRLGEYGKCIMRGVEGVEGLLEGVGIEV